MNQIAVKENQTNSQVKHAVEEAVQEALLAAEFFGFIPHELNVPSPPLPIDPSLVGYLRVAKMDMETPMGLDDLDVLLHAGGRRN